MGRGQSDSELGRFALLALFLMGAIFCCMVYLFLSTVSKPNSITVDSVSELGENGGEVVLGSEEEDGECCGGIEHLELWGDAVKWGSQFKVNSSEECCMACKALCGDQGRPCLCDSWVFCGTGRLVDSDLCWLKKQKDTLDPDRKDSGDLDSSYVDFWTHLWRKRGYCWFGNSIWCSSYNGCHFYRAEDRGSFWDSLGNHVENAPFGPPFALIQGTLEVHGIIFKNILTEVSHTVRRGSVAWIGSGPEFFFSLANHFEWKKRYTVFGSVLPEDMEIAEKISQLPSKQEVWRSINVSVLERPVTLWVRRIKSNS